MSERRPYDSRLRRQRAAETRARIVVAGSELAHSYETWAANTETVQWPDDPTFEAVDQRRRDALRRVVTPPELVPGGLELQQAVIRYTWDGESTTGMLERSIAITQLT